MATRQSQHLFAAALLALVGAQAAHWFITPMRHPNAGAVQTVLVAVQAVVGVGGAFWLLVRQKPASISN